MMGAARSRLASMEAEFLRSRSSGGPFAAGSDRRGLQATAQLLWAKRVRTMARAWPELTRLLGDNFNERATEVLSGIPLSSGDHAVQDGFIVASCPALPGCHTQGKTEEEALANIREAIVACLLTLNDRARRRAQKKGEKRVEVWV